MRRGVLFALCAILFAGLIPFGNAANARALDLQAHMCVGGAESALEAMEMTSDRFDCGEGRFEERDRFVRTHAVLPESFARAGDDLLWQSDPANFKRMILRFTNGNDIVPSLPAPVGPWHHAAPAIKLSGEDAWRPIGAHSIFDYRVGLNRYNV